MKKDGRWFLGITFFMGCICLSFSAQADNFWNEHARGWHWYEDPEQVLEQAMSREPSDPVQIMEVLHQQVKRSLDQAILNPTPENMRNYITLQNQVSEQANRFAVAWQTALLNNPVLDYSLSHPTNSVGKQVYLNTQKQQEDQAIALLAKHSGLFFFYRSSCPYCQRLLQPLWHFGHSNYHR